MRGTGGCAHTSGVGGVVKGAGAPVCGSVPQLMEPAEELELLRRFRRDLHRIPELDRDVPRTLAYIERVLAGLACEVAHPCPGCVCAHFDLGRTDCVAIRADIDALPIAEQTGCSFASEHPGRMHACGHDAHMAMALTCAVWVDRALRERPELLAHNVLFVFQPAEETTGGARSVCESGVFARYGARAVFGFHVWPDLPAGIVASRPGALLARSSETHVRIFGRSLHIAKTLGLSDTELADAGLAAARFAAGTRELMGRLAQDEPCICMFGQLRAGTVCNAVAGRAELAGSLRVFSEAMFDRARAELRALLDEVCAACGCTGEISFAEGYPAVANDDKLFARAEAALSGLARVEQPLLIAEDFSFYQRHLPGVFFLLGVGEPAVGTADGPGCGRGLLVDAGVEGADADADFLGYARSGLHTSTLMFDERILSVGVATYRRLLMGL